MSQDSLFIIPKNVNIPIELYKSIRGEYYVGFTDELLISPGKGAWARLYNPPCSGKILHVNVWTVTETSDSPFEAQFWFNPDPPTIGKDSTHFTPSNTALCPLPEPKIKIQYDSNVDKKPTGGAEAFIRRGEPNLTVADTENGKYIFPPCGSFLIFLTLVDKTKAGTGRVAFGWWEEHIKPCDNK